MKKERKERKEPAAAQKLDQESPVRATGPEKTTDTRLATVSANGQVTLPTFFRSLFGLKARDKLMCRLHVAGEIVLTPVAAPAR